MTPGASPSRPSAPGAAALLKYLEGQRTPLAVVVGLSLLSALGSLAQPLVIQKLLEDVGLTRPIVLTAALLATLVLATAGVDAVRQFLLGRCAEGVVLQVRTSLMAHLLRLPITEFDRRRSGDLMSRVSTDTSVLRALLTGGLVDSLSGSVIVVGSVIAMLLIDPTLLIIAIAVIGTSATILIITSKKIQPLALEAQESVGTLTSGVERALSAVRTIRSLGATTRVNEQLRSEAQRAFASGVSVERIRAILEPTSGLAVQAALLTVLGLGGYRVASGRLGVADLVTFVLFLFMLLTPVSQGFQAVVTVRSSMGALTRIEDIMSIAPEDFGDKTSVAADPTRSLPRTLEFRGVKFGYTAGETVFEDLNLIIPAGSTTAIVGLSGSGKTTLLALIERFYEVESGVITIDGTDICRISRDNLRAELGYVEQNAPVLAGTIRDNLLLAVPDAPDPALRYVLDAVGLLQRVDQHHDGLSATLGDGGIGLSGGEQQRLAIARVLLARRPVLLLDEPTSALDSRSEQTTRDAIQLLGGKCTVVVVAHRLATVRQADQIILLENGRVRAVGRHDELLDDALYRELAEYQFIA